jgi:hypothetical protein
MTSKAANSIRTLEQAYAFVLRVGICGIFSDANSGLISLWDVTDLPERAQGEKGWGQKVIAIWGWKNEANRIYQVIRFDPMTTGELRKEVDMTHRPKRAKFDRALQELQITLNIARRNSLDDEKDTWVLFSEQYLDVLRSHEG